MTDAEVKAVAKLMGVTDINVHRKRRNHNTRLYHATFSDDHSWATFTHSHEAFIERLGRHISERYYGK